MKLAWELRLAASRVSRSIRVLNLGQGVRQREGPETDIEMLYFTRWPSGRTGRGSHLNYTQVIRQDIESVPKAENFTLPRPGGLS